MSRELRWFLRDVEERRDTMIELYEQNEMELVPLSINILVDTVEDMFAAQIREFLISAG